MNIYEPFSRCDCGNPYVYEEKKMLITKESPKKLKRYASESEQSPFILESVTSLHCTKCHKERYQIEDID